MRKLKLSLIANERSRKKTFMKRKKGITKKLHELTTLCGVQACGVIYSPYMSVPEVWPSKEGAQEVAMKFMEMPMETRNKKMMDQETYLREQITKIKEQVDKLAVENRELQVKRFMFDCLEGKMSEYHYGASDLHDLHRYIDQYINQLTQRMQIHLENGESSSLSPLPIGVADIDPSAVADFAVGVNTAAVSAAREFCAHIPYQNMNMNQNLQEPVQYHTSHDFYGHIQGVYNNMTWNHDLNFHLNHNMNLNVDLNSNQYLNQENSFNDMMLAQNVGYDGGHARIPLIDGNHYNYHQQPTGDLAITNHMPSITSSTTSTTSVYASYINNNL
ncbi:PREDICTED: agamous-like MADS-box protein AGL36 [Camelina sativa]|uniref:Agamous-like MADS-box protein AGL36 n=1 Tax=Camelina sativa TaxID=90675 RepID=A0ABM0Y181_CAMSA|nr:PREDICTED: agamous-like MADS-box protein AGL36 [Camelina sativa]